MGHKRGSRQEFTTAGLKQLNKSMAYLEPLIKSLRHSLQLLTASEILNIQRRDGHSSKSMGRCQETRLNQMTRLTGQLKISPHYGSLQHLGMYRCLRLHSSLESRSLYMQCISCYVINHIKLLCQHLVLQLALNHVNLNDIFINLSFV